MDANKLISGAPVELRATGLDPKRLCVDTSGGVALGKQNVIVGRFAEMLRQADELLEDVAGVRIDADAPCQKSLITQQRRWLLVDR